MTLRSLQHALNAAARDSSRCQNGISWPRHTSNEGTALASNHPANHIYKLCLSMHFIRAQQYPDYMRDLVSMTARPSTVTELDFVRPVASRTGSQGSEQSSVNVFSAMIRTCCVELATYTPCCVTLTFMSELFSKVAPRSIIDFINETGFYRKM